MIQSFHDLELVHDINHVKNLKMRMVKHWLT